MRLPVASERASIARFAIVALVAAMALLLRLYQLGHENFWIDEVHQVRVASQSVIEILKNYRPGAAYDTTEQAPLSMLVTHALLSEDGPEWSARLPSALSGALGVVVLFWFARQLLNSYSALLASLLLAISPLDVWYSQEARWYELWGLLTLISYLALVRAVRQPVSRLCWWVLGLASAASLYTFVFSVFVMSSQWASLAWRVLLKLSSSRVARIFVIVSITVLVVGAPVVNMVVRHFDTAHSGTLRPLSMMEIPYTLYAFSVGFTLGPTTQELHFNSSLVKILVDHPEILVVVVVFGGLILRGLWEVGGNKELCTWILPWLFLPPVSVFLTAVAFPAMTYQVRYTFVSLPAFVVVLAVGIASLGRPLRFVALGAVLGLCAVSLGNLFWSERYDKEDVRGAVAHLRGHTTGQVQVIAVGQIAEAVDYYATAPASDVIRGCSRDKLNEGLLDTSGSVWLMCGRDWGQDCGPCLAQLSGDYVEVERVSFVGVDLWCLDPKQPYE